MCYTLRLTLKGLKHKKIKKKKTAINYYKCKITDLLLHCQIKNTVIMHLALKIMCNGFVMRFSGSVRQTEQKDRSSMSQKNWQ